MLKTINISAMHAEKVIDWCGAVLISIHDQHVPPHNLQNLSDENVLRVTFSDVTTELERDGRWYNTISVEQANQIIDFIEKHKEKNIIVNCRAGVSRSAATCLFISLFYGHELKENFYSLSLPNPYVLGMLTREYHVRKVKAAL